jgi:hypothetical protein
VVLPSAPLPRCVAKQTHGRLYLAQRTVDTRRLPQDIQPALSLPMRTFRKRVPMLDYLLRQGSTILRLVLLSAGTMVSIACGDDSTSLATLDGTIQVETVTEGTDFDRDGYVAELNSQTIPIGNLDTKWFTDVEPGNYEVELTGIAENCTTEGNPKSVEVVPVDTVLAVFTVTCDVPAPPPDGGGEDPL